MVLGEECKCPHCNGYGVLNGYCQCCGEEVLTESELREENSRLKDELAQLKEVVESEILSTDPPYGWGPVWERLRGLV